MSTKNQGPLRPQIYQRVDEKGTDELLEIWRTGNHEKWTGTAFDIVEEILLKRLGKIPPQEPSSIPRARSPIVPWLIITGGIGVLLIVAAVVFNAPSAEQAATMTAAAWTATPTRTPTPAATPTETPTATPMPAAVVNGSVVDVREGPGTEYLLQGSLNKNEELDIIGQFKDCAWLKVSSRNQSMIGWISGDKQYVELRITCENIPPGTFRPLTGVIKSNQRGDGYGELTVDNGTTRDGVVILTLSDDPVMAAYIRSGDSFTMKGIRGGTYYLYFSTGAEWNGKAFTTTPSHQKFEDAFEFTSSATTYSIWSVTLHGVVGGTASVEEVDESEFPDIED